MCFRGGCVSGAGGVGGEWVGSGRGLERVGFGAGNGIGTELKHHFGGVGRNSAMRGESFRRGGGRRARGKEGAGKGDTGKGDTGRDRQNEKRRNEWSFVLLVWR